MAQIRLTRHQQERAAKVVWPLLPALLRTAQYLTHHQQEAEDLAQETAIKAMRHIDSFKPGTDAKAWLMTILRRTHIDSIRTAARRIQPLSLDAGEQTIDPPAPAAIADPPTVNDPRALIERFDDDEMIEAIKNLGEDIRWTLLLVDVEQMDHADAAEVLGVPEGTGKSRVHRGRSMLRQHLMHTAVARGWTDEPTGVES